MTVRPERLRLMVLAKSRWHPAIRREHALTFALLEQGHHVTFVERARDVRDLRRGTRIRTRLVDGPERLRLVSPFVPVPGHHDPASYRVDTAILGAVVKRLSRQDPYDAIVVNAPWNWRAAVLGSTAGTRRVLDIGDDWATLMPHRAEAIHGMYAEISREADAVVGVAPALQKLFDRPIDVVPNATAPEVLRNPPTPAPGRRRMAYVGTLSERFDDVLMERVLELLPEWELDLYGPCRYSGLQEQPAEGLTRLLGAAGGRARWHGAVSRDRLADVIDGADVLVLPNVPRFTTGQDPMKLYDYAARDRPIVATAMRVPASAPPAFLRTDTAADFAAAVTSSAERYVPGNRAWAESNSWQARLGPWLRTVVGDGHEF